MNNIESSLNVNRMYGKVVTKSGEFINFIFLIFLISIAIMEIAVPSSKDSYFLFLHCFIGVIFFFNNYKSMNIKLLLIVFIDIVFILLANILHPALGSMLQLVNSMLLMLSFSQISLRKKHLRLVYLLVFFEIFALAITCKKSGMYYITMFNKVINPNGIGFLYFIGTISLVAVFNLSDGKAKHLCIPIILLVGMYFIYTTDARTSMVALLINIVFYVFRYLKMFTKEKNYRRLIVFGWMIVFIIPVIYVSLYKAVGDNGIVILGKDIFSGREKVWADAFRMIADNPILGVGNDDLFAGVWDSAHNSLLAIWKTSGLVPLITYIYLFVMPCYLNKHKYEIVPYLRTVIVSLLFIATFETIYTDKNLYIFGLLPLINKILVDKEVKYDT